MQALALKYRPKSFYELIGQDAIKENLIGALNSGRLGHAYLFSGLRGSGKTSSARIFAKDLLCQKGISSHACETCENCVAANEGRHIDIIEMDAASHRKIEDIRDLNEQTRYAPISGRFKIFIIDEAHMLTKEASNAFLKTLEEPPPYIKFILATTDPLKLPATILSRTQHFRFKAINTELIVKHLEDILAKEQIAFESDALKIIARSGSGSLRDTLTLLDQAIIFCNANISAAAVSDMLGLLDPAKIEEILAVVTRGAHDELCTLIKSLETNDAEMVINELIASLKEKFIAPMPEFSLLIFERFFKVLSDAKNMLGAGADPAFTLYITLFEMKECFVLKPQNEAFVPVNFMSENFQAQIKQNPQIPANNNAQQNPALKANEPKNLTNTQNEQSSLNTLSDSQKYKNFLNLIYDRSFDLGKLFENFIEFLGFDGSSITLLSKAQGIDAGKLKNNSNVIKEIALKTFGVSKFRIQKQEPISEAVMLEKIIAQNQPEFSKNLKAENSENSISENSRNFQPENSIQAQNFQPENSIQAQNFQPENSQNPENSQPEFFENSQNLAQVQTENFQPENSSPEPENSKNSYSQANASIIELNSLFGEPEIIKS